jgi:hypothetical protein
VLYRRFLGAAAGEQKQGKHDQESGARDRHAEKSITQPRHCLCGAIPSGDVMASCVQTKRNLFSEITILFDGLKRRLLKALFIA